MRHSIITALAIMAVLAGVLPAGFEVNASERLVARPGEGAEKKAHFVADAPEADQHGDAADTAVYEGRLGILGEDDDSLWEEAERVDLLGSELEGLEGDPSQKQVEIANCNDVDFKITNSYVKSGSDYVSIRIRYVKFYNVERATWYTEDLTDTTLKHGYYAWWYNQDLEDSQNYTISYWKVYYYLVYPDGTVSDSTYSKTFPVDVVCANDMDVKLTM